MTASLGVCKKECCDPTVSTRSIEPTRRSTSWAKWCLAIRCTPWVSRIRHTFRSIVKSPRYCGRVARVVVGDLVWLLTDHHSHCHDDDDDDTLSVQVLMELYQDMGNRLALQYGGSHLAHTVKTYQYDVIWLCHVLQACEVDSLVTIIKKSRYHRNPAISLRPFADTTQTRSSTRRNKTRSTCS